MYRVLPIIYVYNFIVGGYIWKEMNEPQREITKLCYQHTAIKRIIYVLYEYIDRTD